MKKLFVLTVLVALVLAGCPQSTNDNNESKEQTITIKNESSYTLINVKFIDLTFSTSSTNNELLVSSQAIQQITTDLINESGYITFNFKDTPEVACRTERIITVSDEDLTFTFLDTTIVEELANSNNKKPLSQITFSRIAIEKGGRSVVRNDIVPLDETIENYISQHEFSIKNTGVSKLKLTGNEPVRISSSNDVFSIIQPTSSEINTNGTLTFIVNFNPKAMRSYSTQITVYSDDQNGDFMFTITAVGTASKPTVIISYESNNIAQNGTINIGEEYITLSRSISIIIKNTGTNVLTIEPERITITGADAAAFTKITNPGGNISVNSQTSFDIGFKPTKQGEHNATLRIPTNDSSRNPVEVYLKGTGKKGDAVFQLSQETDNIQNNSLTPIDFKNVDLGTNKTLIFTIKNTGIINLELTGEKIVESSNDLFDIPTPPTNRIILPGETGSFIIRYSPTIEHEDTSTITILNNTDSLVFTFTVKGNGYVKRPQIGIQQGSTNINFRGEYNFNNVGIGDNKDIPFNIKNTGDANLIFIPVYENCVNLLDNSGNHFVVLQQPSSSTEVPINGTSAFVIRFIPTAVVTNYTVTVQIKTNSRTNEDFTFSIRGNSYEKKPQITVKKDNKTINQNGDFDFGSKRPNTETDATFTIMNSGEANLSFNVVEGNVINLSGNADKYFSVNKQPSATMTIAPGNTTTFEIRFSPKKVGNNFNAEVTIATNSENDKEFSFWVKGNGSNVYKIGDTGPGGGKVFFAEGGQYKECSGDLGSGVWSETVNIAKNHKGGGFTNWKLPERSELESMYVNRTVIGEFYNAGYWSSTEYSTNRAWFMSYSIDIISYSIGNDKTYIYYGGRGTPYKTTIFRVRAVRSFSL